MELEMRHLKVLVAVADAGSVTAAAAAMGVTQPGLSAQVHRIERALGGPVFERGRDGVNLTSLGDLVIDGARDVMRGFEGLLQEVGRRTGEHASLRVGATTSRFFSLFLTRLAEAGLCRELVPRVHADTGVMTERLLTGDCDVAVVGLTLGYTDDCPGELDDLVVVEREPLFIAMSRSHPCASRDEVEFGEFGDDDWLLPPGQPSGTYTALQDQFRKAGIAPQSRLGRQNLADYWDYVAAGHAVSLALPPNSAARGAVIVPVRGAPIAWRRVLRWHPDRVSPDEARVCADTARRAYAELLQDTAALEPWWDATPEHRPVVAGPDRPPSTEEDR